jgi:hypothetical protein
VKFLDKSQLYKYAGKSAVIMPALFQHPTRLKYVAQQNRGDPIPYDLSLLVENG